MKKYKSLLLASLLISVFVFTTPTLATAPEGVKSLRAIAGSNAIYLSWEHSSDLNENVLGYKLYLSNDGVDFFEERTIVAPEGGILNNFYTASDLMNGTEYILKLVAYNTNLEESNALITDVIIPVDNSDTDTIPPEDISSFSVVSGDRKISFNFTHSANIVGDLIGYMIYASNDDGVTFSDEVFIGYNNNYNYTGLENDKEYFFKIVSLDSVGNQSTGVTMKSTPKSATGSGIILGGAPITTPTFKDVTDGPFKQYIEYLSARGIINGYSDGSFRPNVVLSRAEGVTLLLKSSGLELDMGIEVGTFSDVPESHGLSAYIENAYSYSIVDGYADGRFGPSDNLTRAQFVKIMVEVFSKKLSKIPDAYIKFSDVDKEHVFAPWIYSAYKVGITKGYEDSTFKPDATITRAEAATMIARYFQNKNAPSIDSTIEELQLLSLINNTRSEYNSVLYRIDEPLSLVSRNHAEDLAKNVKTPQYYGSDGSLPSQRLDMAGILYKSVSENVAIASYEHMSITDTLESIHEEIMKQADNEQNEKANILSTYKNFSEVGIGVYVDEEMKMIYVVVDFMEREE